VYCSVVQCVAVCCRVLQCVVTQVSDVVLRCVAVCCSMLHCVVAHVSLLATWCCCVLQCFAACCSVLQCVAVCRPAHILACEVALHVCRSVMQCLISHVSSRATWCCSVV